MQVAATDDDDWETDPDFVNDVSEEEQRWGSKTVEGSGRKENFSMEQLRGNVVQDHAAKSAAEAHDSVRDIKKGFGGKYGVQTDRMDKSAVGHDYQGKTEEHASVRDMKRGFGGKFGVQTDRMDKSAVGHDYQGRHLPDLCIVHFKSSRICRLQARLSSFYVLFWRARVRACIRALF